jgi:hypothetical protein
VTLKVIDNKGAISYDEVVITVIKKAMTAEECTKYCREYHGTSKIHGPESYGKVIDGICNCYCKRGYEPDKTLTCVKVEAADSKLRIAKLYTSKTEYDIGDKVEVSYIIKNDGSVNVDKYQVGYRIFDSIGEKVYGHVGGVHSIAAGEEKGWNSEEWIIPSNAKSGKYVVEAKLAWTSKTTIETTSETTSWVFG